MLENREDAKNVKKKVAKNDGERDCGDRNRRLSSRGVISTIGYQSKYEFYL